MPKKKVTITYLCEICLSEFPYQESALVCEKRGVAIPDFKSNEVIELVGLLQVTVFSGFKVKLQNGTKGIVNSGGCGRRDDYVEPHKLPAYYEVWIQTPGGPDKKEIVEILRENLRKVIVKDGAFCPLCASAAKPVKEVCHMFLTTKSELPLLKNVPMQKCSNCNAEFFTTEQSKKVELLVRKKIKWPVANTQRLLKEF